MNQLSATANAASAALTLGDLAQPQEATSATSPTGIGQYASAPGGIDAETPAVINDVQDIRTKLSPSDVSAVAAALGPPDPNGTPATQAQTLDFTVGAIASRLDQGQETLLFVTKLGNGASISTVMSKSEFDAAMASDDPASMGSFEGADGKTIYVKDLISPLTGTAGPLGTASAPDPKIALAWGIIKSMQSASKGAVPDGAVGPGPGDTPSPTPDNTGENVVSFSASVFEPSSDGSQSTASYTHLGS
jgi:hypothetical protein